MLRRERADLIFDKINSLIDKINLIKEVNNIQSALECNEYEINDILDYLVEQAYDIKRKIRKIYYQEEVGSIQVSFADIKNDIERGDLERAKRKLEFELLPLAENLRMDFYYYGYIFPDINKIKRYFSGEVKEYYRNVYVEKAKKEFKYKYDLSIVVTSYNKLEYTKACINSLLMHLPKGLKYEMILVNHGSSDGTKEYFSGLNVEKQIDIAFNGGGCDIVDRIVEGHYVLRICNDVLVTDNAIDNMYKCITSDKNIAWVVATTPNVSNNQTIDAVYNDMEEMYAFAKANNVSEERRWEQKVRLCNPIDLYDIEKKLECVCGKVAGQANGCFIDDKTSMFYRRAGYKIMLAKDAYCFHFGSVTIGDELSNQRRMTLFYLKGRIDYLKEYGMDPWGYGHNLDTKLMKFVTVTSREDVKILGINSGLCSNLLRIKDRYKEELDNRKVWITCLSEEEMNIPDQKGIADEIIHTKIMVGIEGLTELYDTILFENGINIDNVSLLQVLMTKRKGEGEIWIRVTESEVAKNISNLYVVRNTVETSGAFWICI